MKKESKEYVKLSDVAKKLKDGETIIVIVNNELIIGYKKGYLSTKINTKESKSLYNLLKTWKERNIFTFDVVVDNVSIDDTNNPFIYKLKIRNKTFILTVPELETLYNLLNKKYHEIHNNK